MAAGGGSGGVGFRGVALEGGVVLTMKGEDVGLWEVDVVSGLALGSVTRGMATSQPRPLFC